MKITKAVFPVAGLGTRFLPATKANPKEMMPIVDKPLIQYAVEDALAAGITELIFVTSSSKRAIEDHFDSNFELEASLLEKGKIDLLEIVHSILPTHISCAYIRQRSPLGLGHAVLCAKQFVINEPFAVLLADDLIDGGSQSCMQQMVEIFAKTQSSIVAVEKIRPSDTKNYGVVDINTDQMPLSVIHDIIEKPDPADAPSHYGVVGRYILTPAIFDLLAQTTHGSGGEIQLTDAIAKLLTNEKVHAFQFKGKRYDCGNKIGYVEATIAYALKHPELSESLKNILKGFVEGI